MAQANVNIESGAANTVTAVAPTAPAGWGGRNGRLLAIAAGFFLLNQLLELIVLHATGHRYIDLCRWDCGWYDSLVEHGYDRAPHAVGADHPRHDAANWAFFPAFPLIATALQRLTGMAPFLSLVLVGKLCFLLAVFAFVKLADDPAGAASARRPLAPRLHPALAAAMVTLNPYSIYGNVGYTEPLFLLLTCAFLYFLRRDWLLAGLAGCLLACTRIVGAFAIAPYCLAAAAAWRRDRTQREPIVLGLLLIPAGLGVFLLYLHGLTGDALAFSHVQRAWNRTPGNPLGHIWHGLHQGGVERYWAAMAGLALLAPVWLAVRKHYELALLALACTALPLATGLQCSPRYIWWQAPILLTVGAIVSRRKLWLLFFLLALPGLVYMGLAWFGTGDFVT